MLDETSPALPGSRAAWADRRPAVRAGAGVQPGMAVTWAAARFERWHPARVPSVGSSGLVISSHGPMYGGIVLLFGIGDAGVRTVRRLTQPGWFDDLQPRPEDVAFCGGQVAGHWSAPTGAGQAEADEGMRRQTKAAALPSACLAIVMVPHGDGAAERAAALSLVAALRQRTDPMGGRLRVAVTVEGGIGVLDGFVGHLARLGAFVLRPGRHAGGFGLHSFPLRHLADPVAGRIVCTDLADTLHLTRPGRIGVRHVLPARPDTVGPAVARLIGLSSGTTAVMLNVQLDLVDDQTLLRLDRLGTFCRDAAGPDAGIMFVDGDRPDGRTGLMDLVVIRGR